MSSTYVICASMSCDILLSFVVRSAGPQAHGDAVQVDLYGVEMESVDRRDLSCRDDQVARFPKGSVYLWVKLKKFSASTGLERCVPDEQGHYKLRAAEIHSPETPLSPWHQCA